MVVLLEGSPISTEELSVTIGFLVTSSPKALLPLLLSLARQPALGSLLLLLLLLLFIIYYKKTQGRCNIKVLEHEGQTIQHQVTIKHVSVFPQQSHPYV